MLNYTVRQSGALFQGSIQRDLKLAIDEAERAVATEGVNEVRGALRQVLQHSTGHYASQIQTERRQDHWEVNDNESVYGPWLAGVSSLNRSSRFRGYHHWRIATQRLDARAVGIAEHIIMQRLGG